MKKIRFIIIISLLLLISMDVKAATTKPAVPVLKKITVKGYNSLEISWEKVRGCTGYVVYRKNDSGKYIKIAILNGYKNITYLDKKLVTGKKYTYTVRSYVKKSAKIIYSNYSKKGISGKPIPNVPTAISAKGENGIVSLTWKKVSGASGYYVYRASSKEGVYKALKPVKTASYSDSTVVPGNTYYYKLKAFRLISKKRIYSGFSKIVTVKTRINNKASTFTEFGQIASDLTKNYNNISNIGAMESDEFYSGRLIVKGKKSNISFDSVNPISIIYGPENYYVLQFASSTAASKAYELISEWSAIEYVEPDSYVEGSTSGTGITGEENGGAFYSWGVEKIGANQYASYLSKTTTSHIKVAVVDSGVSGHSYLQARLLKGYDFVEGDNDPDDANGHGTHVAGIIVDCTPGLNVDILPVRVLNAYNNGNVLRTGNGIRFAAEQGAKVINLSLGGKHSDYIDDSIQYAIKKGAVIVAAAGNEYGNTADFCPAHLENVIVVGAVNTNLAKAIFSNAGSSLDVVAPGVDITSCFLGNQWITMNGTSMAAPHVSAIAAMFRLRYPNKSVKEIETSIKKYVKPLGTGPWNTVFGNGIPDLTLAILDDYSNIPSVTTTPTPSPTPIPTPTPSYSSLETVIREYDNYLSDLGTYGVSGEVHTFGVAYITDDNIPDLVVSETNGRQFTAMINGRNLSSYYYYSGTSYIFSYYPRRNVMCFTEEIEPWKEGYYTFKEQGRPYVLVELLWKNDHYNYYYIYDVNENAVKVDKEKYEIEELKIAGTSKRTEINWIRNTQENRKKYLLSIANISSITTPTPTPTATPIPTPTPTPKPTVTPTPIPERSFISIPSDGYKAAGLSFGNGSYAFLRSDGSVWTWGWNYFGQAGVKYGGEYITEATKIFENAKYVNCEGNHLSIIKNDNTLWTCGDNRYGELGDGTTGNRFAPVQVFSNVADVKNGWYHTVILKTDGSVWTCGGNSSGQLGNGTKINQTEPVKIMDNVKAIAAGSNYTAMVKRDGTLWVCGTLYEGIHTSPVEVTFGVQNIEGGWYHLLLLKTDSSLWGMGQGDDGQLGNGSSSYQHEPVKIMTGVKDMAAGWEHSLVLLNNGALYVCGSNSFGCLGTGGAPEAYYYSPVLVLTDVSRVFGGNNNSAVIKKDGSCWICGAKLSGSSFVESAYFSKIM